MVFTFFSMSFAEELSMAFLMRAAISCSSLPCPVPDVQPEGERVVGLGLDDPVRRGVQEIRVPRVDVAAAVGSTC